MHTPIRVPLATYRIQFNKDFTFLQALQIVDYLRRLGIHDLYASPIFQAGPESTHGYDICNFGTLSPALGGGKCFEKLSHALRDAGMGLLMDMVPNHMGNDQTNCWWRDVLKYGRNSQFGNFFDINWDTPEPGLKDKVLLPVLGDHYNQVLEKGELKIIYKDNDLLLTYYSADFPLSPASIHEIGLSFLQFVDGEKQAHWVQAISKSLTTNKDPSSWLNHLDGKTEQVEAFLRELNGKAGQSKSFNHLHRVLEAQHYRLAFWRIGPEEINYRRFFDITQLVSLKMEHREVFEQANQVAMQMLASGAITGLRIDHPDGLWDPKGYFANLQQTFQDKSKTSAEVYVVAEKILSEDETLPSDWQVHGTTGYDYLNQLNGIFIKPDSEESFHHFYQKFTSNDDSMLHLLLGAKRKLLNSSFISEKRGLTRRLKLLASQSRTGRDLAQTQLELAIEELLAWFPIYRTYVDDATTSLSKADSHYLDHAVAKAGKAIDPQAKASLEFLHRILELQFPFDFDDAARDEARTFVMKFQQLSGPLMAKGLEDTTFYRYFPFISMNEVGGNPSEWGIKPERFHAFNAKRAEDWPHSLSATATHDTKRGEDTRARLNVLSEISDEWQKQVQGWSKLNSCFKQNDSPTPNDEYLLYQTLTGVWPFAATPQALQSLTERVQAYMQKAIREAKLHSSWIDPHQKYEDGIASFVAAILNPASEFAKSFAAFHQPISYFGQFNSLSQTLLKITSPGVPDFYQGCELWDFSMVDPDNRRPVDYSLRKSLLDKVGSMDEKQAGNLFEEWQSGLVKMYVTTKALNFRKKHKDIFQQGSYEPLSFTGQKADHLFGFARDYHGKTVLAIAPRFICTLMQGEQKLPIGAVWENSLAIMKKGNGSSRYRNVFTGELVSSGPSSKGFNLQDLFNTFPLALLEEA